VLDRDPADQLARAQSCEELVQLIRRYPRSIAGFT